MKSLAQLLFLAAVLPLFSGCASPNYDKGSATGAGLQAAADRLSQDSARIDATLNCLNDLVSKPGDLVAQFKAYSAGVNNLDSSAKDVQSKVAAMWRKGNDYFKAWDKETAQIHNEDIKNRSAARKAEMQQKFTEIKMSYTEASEALKPFMSDLKDIQKALATDLTPGGASALKEPADKANKDAVPLKASLDKLATQFKELGAAFQAAPPPPPAPSQ